MSTENDQLTIWIKNMRTNRDAFAALYEEMSRPMYTVACRILHNRTDAEDIVQDVFLKMLKTDDYTAVGKVRAYILQMVRNEALMLLRRRSREDLVEDVTVDCDSAWHDSETHEDVAAIVSAIEHLNADERDIFTLHVNGELGFEEIAGIMNMSISAVYRRYQKALKKLRKMMNGGSL
ncbi:MAG: sigma-70 family RNA polymerase sigma factor [Lachnospiraceae bacterium]|nr:sigma-70 family RNA polymerase sigma factor [Lachnospiraceae bacterium]